MPRQLPSHRMRGRFHLAGDDLQKRRAIAVELLGAHAVDDGHLIQRRGPRLGHLDQCAVGENDIGRHPRRLGQRPPFRFQSRKKRRILVRNHCPDLRTSGCLGNSVLAKPDAFLAPQDRAGGVGQPERTVPLGVGPHQIVPHHLPENRGPLPPVDIAANPERRQPVVASGANFVRPRARHHVDQMPGAEIFARPQHGRKRLPHRLGAVEGLRRRVAQVAGPTGRALLAEISQQRHPPAILSLGQPQKRIQPSVIGQPALRRRKPLVDLHPAEADVVGTVKRQRFRRGAVAARAADLLIVGLDRLRQVGVRHPADIRFVDPHPEGDRRHHDQPVLDLKAPLDLTPALRLHPAVIGDGFQPRFAQRPGQRFRLGPRAAIDDPRAAPAGGSKVQDLLAGFQFGGESQVNVGSVKSAKKYPRPRPGEQPRYDLGPGFRVRGRGERRQWHVQSAPQRPDPKVIRPEIVAPLADAMGLVHRQKRHTRLGQHPVRSTRRKSLGRHVEKFQVTPLKRIEYRAGLGFGVARRQRPRGNACLAKRPDLIAHERDQRRHDDRQPGPQKRRQLKAKRLATARRQDREHILAPGNGIHDIRLHRAKRCKAENLR